MSAFPEPASASARQTGIVRHIDELGRIVIPIEIRKRLRLGEKDPIEIAVKGETILLSKPTSLCVFCGRDDGLEEHRGRSVCRGCIAELTSGSENAGATGIPGRGGSSVRQ